MHRTLQTTTSLCFLILILSANRTSAQYRFDAWTTENGLPHNTIKAILQTRDGYLWLASLDGLVRFDGVRFTVFNSSNTPGLNSNRFISLFEDQIGALWIGTEDSGLVKFDEGRFTTFGTGQGLPGNFVRRIWADDAGSILLLIGERLFRWREGKAEAYALPTNAPSTFVGDYQQNGHLWYRDQTGVHVLGSGRSVTLTEASGLSSSEISAVYQDRQGTIWVGTVHSGLNRVKDGVVTVFTTKDGLPEGYVRAMREDRAGNLWLALDTSGLVRYRDGHFTHYTTADGLSDNSVLEIYEDREGTLWVGTYTHGLNRLSKDVFRMYSEQDGLPANNTYPILEDRAANIWLGTWGKGLTRFANGQFTLYRKAQGLPEESPSALAEDRDGALWIGTYGGVARFKDGQFTSFKELLGPGAYHVSAILPDHDGTMWFGADTGLFRLKDGVLTVLTTKDGLAADEVRAILRDSKGVLWVGCYGGLSRLAGDHWSTFGKQDGLAGEKVRSLYEDREGALWIGTYEGGLSRFKDDRITGITQKDGLYNNGVFQILEDGRGNFWLSCNVGIYKVNKQELNDFADGKVKFVTSVPYGRHDGLSTIECNGGAQPAGIKTHDGRLWFPTQGGAAVIDPNEITFNPQPPPVVIEACLVDRTLTDCRQGITLAPHQQSLEVSYTGLSFIKSEQIRFKYKLTGLDRDWTDVGTLRTAHYSHLPPGTYNFTVIAANSDGVWNIQGQSMSITVVPPFWRTWWFVALLSLTVVTAAALMYRRRIANLKHERDAKEEFSRRLIDSQESERKRIAGELHDSLGQSLAVIKNHALFALHGPADLEMAREELKQISIQSAQAIDEVKEISYNLRPYLLDQLGLTKAIESMLNRVAESSGIAFSVEIDDVDGVFSADEEISLYRILQETVNNIVKHSDAATALVRLKRDSRTIKVTIEDDGKGFHPQATGAAATGASHKHGFGLMGIAERVRMLGGSFLIQSAPGKGTTITVRIDVNKK